MATRIGTITGIALAPGVSRNGRLYTAEAIAKAVARAQARIDEDGEPLTMLTHHGADDDSRQIVGRLTSITQLEDGRAAYTADLANTDEARDIASLVDTRKGPAFLKGVSIRGAWIGKVRTERGPDGAQVQTADDLELDGLDFTRKPGVPGARVDTFTPAGGAPEETAPDGRMLITESVQEALVTAITEDESAPEASVTITETAAAESGPFADPTYHDEPRLPVGTRAQAKAAWLALTESSNAREYTAAQLKRVRQRVGKALKTHGVTVETTEGWLIDPPAPLSECFGYGDDPGHGGDLAVSLSNGPVTVTVSSWCVDPHDLMAVGHAAMTGACTALATIDPDMDADIDVPGADAEDTDGDMGAAETARAASHPPLVEAPAVPTPSAQTPAPETPAAEPITQEKEPAMAESTTPAATTPGTDSGIDVLSAKFDKLTDAIAGLVTKMAPPVEAAPAPVAPVAEAVPAPAPVAETEEQRMNRLVEAAVQARLAEAVQQHVEQNGPPTRKGLVTQVAEHTAPAGGSGLNGQGVPSDWPDKPLHTYTDEERARYFGPAMEDHVFGHRTR